MGYPPMDKCCLLPWRCWISDMGRKVAFICDGMALALLSSLCTGCTMHVASMHSS